MIDLRVRSYIVRMPSLCVSPLWSMQVCEVLLAATTNVSGSQGAVGPGTAHSGSRSAGRAEPGSGRGAEQWGWMSPGPAYACTCHTHTYAVVASTSAEAFASAAHVQVYCSSSKLTCTRLLKGRCRVYAQEMQRLFVCRSMRKHPMSNMMTLAHTVIVAVAAVVAGVTGVAGVAGVAVAGTAPSPALVPTRAATKAAKCANDTRKIVFCSPIRSPIKFPRAALPGMRDHDTDTACGFMILPAPTCTRMLTHCAYLSQTSLSLSLSLSFFLSFSLATSSPPSG